jgi:hypothetical protein
MYAATAVAQLDAASSMIDNLEEGVCVRPTSFRGASCSVWPTATSAHCTRGRPTGIAGLAPRPPTLTTGNSFGKLTAVRIAELQLLM